MSGQRDGDEAVGAEVEAVLAVRSSAGSAAFPPTRIGVVVPAKDERELLGACLDAVVAAARHVNVLVTVVVVLDDCSDGSASVVEGYGSTCVDAEIHAVSITANSVGRARRAGVSAIIERYGRTGTWLACTDADSLVPPHWLSAQLRHAAAGAHVVAGTIAVQDWSQHRRDVRDRALAAYSTATHADHGHVHGANLSFTADAYLAAGGFPEVTFDEDVALVAAFRNTDQPIAWARDIPVITSARRHSRAPKGFATYLRDLHDAT